jgi:hypothetical protein
MGETNGALYLDEERRRLGVLWGDCLVRSSCRADFLDRWGHQRYSQRPLLIDGVMLLWFLLTAFVAMDIRSTPEPPVITWAAPV